MEWVRIYPMVANWPGGGPPPVFSISADENGSVVVELAWDPQALMAPATYVNPLRYYCSSYAFNETVTNDNGSTTTISIPAQQIQLVGNRATWSIPQLLWDAYVQESLKSLRSPATTAFSRNLYYRVRALAPGASQACLWPADGTLTGANSAAAPHIGILPISASPSTQIAPDQSAIAAMGGIPAIAPTMWSDLLMLHWRHLPESDANRQVLVHIFGHPTYQAANLATRAALLKLWLFAGSDSRLRLPQLLDRNAVVGSNMVQPIVTKLDRRNNKTLVENLLSLLDITPHPDLLKVISKEQLLDHVIVEILDPNGQVNQGAAGTCSPTSLQTLLITINPSEYARLQNGLLSASGSATLGNNDVMDVPVGILQASHYASVAGQPFLMRTYSELAFQTALLKYAKGSNFPAFTGTPQNINQIFQATISGGLQSSETERALEGIFDTRFTTHYITFPSQSTNPSWLAAQRTIGDGLISSLPANQQQLLMAMYWSQPYNYGHVVMAVRHEASSGRVFFKNPQYPGSNPPAGIAQGGTANNPPRRYDDPSQSIESLSDADLSTWIKGYWVPERSLI